MEFETIPTSLDLSTNEKKKSTVLTDESFSDLNFIRLGAGAQSIILDIQTGLYVGAEAFTSAPFSVDFDGKVIASDITITGGSVSGITLSGLATGSDINIQGWSSSLVFSATDYRTVTWTTGSIKLADGTTFSIGTGNTGNMAALTYIYLDKGVSITALQVTTTATTAVGANKILIAVAKNNTDTTSKATLQVFGGSGGQLITVDNIAANSASVNEFISNTAQIKDAIITNAKITSLEVSKLLAGTITSKTITLAITDTTGDAYIAAGKTDFTNTQSGFILGLDDSDSNLAKFYIGSSTVYLNWTGAALTVVGGTITGGVIQTATTGRRLVISNASSKVQWMNNDSEEGYIYNDGSGNMTIDADNILNLVADGDGDDVSLKAADLVYTESDVLWSQCDGYRTVYCDNDIINFNDDATGGSTVWKDRGDNEMLLTDAGELYVDGDFHSGGADYAEFFESVDGKKIPVGTTVINENDKVRPTKNGEIPIGVISAKPTIIGNSDSDCGLSWSGKYLTDEFGSRIIEEAEYWSKYEMVEREKETGQKTKRKEHTYGFSDEQKAPKDAIKKIVKREKLNPAWDNTRKYIPRKERPEWNIVGLTGRVRIIKGQPTNPNWIKLKDISNKVEEWLIK